MDRAEASPEEEESLSSGNIPICRPWPGVPSMPFCTSSHSVNSPKRLGAARLEPLVRRPSAAAGSGSGSGSAKRTVGGASPTPAMETWGVLARACPGFSRLSGWRRYAWSPPGVTTIGRGSLGWLGVLLRRASIAPPLRVRGRGRGRQRHLLLRRGRAQRAARAGALAVSLEAATVSFAAFPLASLACATGAGFVRSMTKAFAGALVGILLAFASAPTLLTSVSAMMHEPDSTMESGRLIAVRRRALRDASGRYARVAATRTGSHRSSRQLFRTCSPRVPRADGDPRARWEPRIPTVYSWVSIGTRVAHRQTVTKFSRNRNREIGTPRARGVGRAEGSMPEAAERHGAVFVLSREKSLSGANPPEGLSVRERAVCRASRALDGLRWGRSRAR